MSASEWYAFVPWIIIVPPGQELTSFEKLFRPFQTSVWLLVLLLLAFACIIIIIIKRQNILVRELVFGVNNRTPLLNVTLVSVGGTLHKLPAKSFPRVLLMIFILYGLVMRSIYQGSLVHNLQSGDRKPPISSVAELMEKKIESYLSPTAVEHAMGFSIINRYTINLLLSAFCVIDMHFFKINHLRS